MENKVEKVKVYSEKEGAYIDIDVINKGGGAMHTCVMLVVDEDE